MKKIDLANKPNDQLPLSMMEAYEYRNTDFVHWHGADGYSNIVKGEPDPNAKATQSATEKKGFFDKLGGLADKVKGAVDSIKGNNSDATSSTTNNTTPEASKPHETTIMGMHPITFVLVGVGVLTLGIVSVKLINKSKQK